MKHFISLAAAAATMLIAASCAVKEDRIQCQAPVTVAVKTFSVSQEDIPLTKAALSVADVAAVKSITLAFFKSDGTEEENLDVKAEVLDASGNTLNTITVANVPFKRNRATSLSGACYSAFGSAGFQAETTFLPDCNFSF